MLIIQFMCTHHINRLKRALQMNYEKYIVNLLGLTLSRLGQLKPDTYNEIYSDTLGVAIYIKLEHDRGLKPYHLIFYSLFAILY